MRVQDEPGYIYDDIPEPDSFSHYAQAHREEDLRWEPLTPEAASERRLMLS